MEPTITILIGSPLSGDEASFLQRLHADLEGLEGIILANFYAADQQIDFVVVTAAHAAAILELKNFRLPIHGYENGGWSFLNSAGKTIPYAGSNPYQQTAKQKYALSDKMKCYRQKNPDVPAPAGDRFYKDFAAFVCIFPEIHPDSRVTSGDNRVHVRSYPDIIEDLRGLKQSTWSLSDWRKFAENGLKLSVTTLAEAIDAKVYEAHQKTRAYRRRIKELIGFNLPPLIGNARDPQYGHNLVASLLKPCNHFLVGPSGSSKTFHLHHLTLVLAESDTEAPLFVEGKKYRGGDFWTFLKHATAPFFPGDPSELLEAIRLTGALPVLIVDALNECSDRHSIDLLRGAQAFALRYGARAVFTSQQPIDLPADLQATPQLLPLPDAEQRRLIFSHHAGLAPTADADRFFDGFTNAYDLTLAGRCYQLGAPPASRADLYDRYVHHQLPQHIGAALLRQVADEMGNTLTTAWTRHTFEATAERFLLDAKASLTVIDELLRSRLVDLSDAFFSFEHELLLDYFRAEALQRRIPCVEDLACELKRPRNERLLELVLPRYSSPAEISTLLSATGNVEALSRICRGHCGERAMSVVVEQCTALLDTALEDVAHLDVSLPRSGAGARQTLSITGNRDWTGRDAVLCDVIAQNLHHPQLKRKFLDLLDSTEWKLRTVIHAGARTAGFNIGDVWEEVVRMYGGVLQHGTMTLPCSAILSALRMTLMGVRHTGAGLVIREPLILRTRRSPESHFALLMLLQDHEVARDAERVQENLQVVEQGLKSQIYILQVEALEYLQFMHSTLSERCPEELPRIRQMIESIDRDNIMLNTAIVETLAFYDFLEPLVTAEDAFSEVKTIISVSVDDPELIQLATMFNVTPSECLASRAYGCISRIFEDVFQGAYWDAYAVLSDDEKGRLLYLASQSRDRGSSFDWILAELLRYGGPQALPAFQRFAAGVEDQCFVQEAVTCFALGMQGCARHSSSPPPYTAGDSPAHQAWQIVGDILYWRFKGTDPNDLRFEKLWARFDGPLRLAAADVFYQLRHAHNWHFRGDGQALDLIAAFPEKIRPILETCLQHREKLSSILQYGGSKDRNLIRFLIAALGKAGSSSTIPLLERLVEDAELGQDCIKAIERIQRRASSRPAPDAPSSRDGT